MRCMMESVEQSGMRKVGTASEEDRRGRSLEQKIDNNNLENGKNENI